MRLLSKVETFYRLKWYNHFRLLTNASTNLQDVELNKNIKHTIENHWREKANIGKFDVNKTDEKYYVLSMFPYPSGNLHMGHVRVYTISDAMARFHRMCGKNVFQPIGWDAFGLPAENAAIQRGIEPSVWTKQNIAQMKQQLQLLGCSFDWKYELSTCSADYYKWTQQLFLMLHKEGLAYQNEALVNWDPIDKTVLADEQVDSNGCSWRSGAKVEKKFLRQWFIRTSVFASKLLDGLDDPTLQDWRDIINLQRHWIGECNGYSFQLLTSASNLLRIWTEEPERLKDINAFVVLKPSHYLSKLKASERLTIENPFAGTTMPIIFSDVPCFPDKCDVYLASPNISDQDKILQEQSGLPYTTQSTKIKLNLESLRSEVIEAAKRLKIGGYPVSSKLQDWLISRQRHWGTPIPIIHCNKCGAVPVPVNELPVLLPEESTTSINFNLESLRCTCPSCGNTEARRETDTMDTFVDSSWYYLRFLDAKNNEKIFDDTIVKRHMPVNLYIGGKEHAVLHLYYARFMNHFLHSLGMVPTSEPFSRLLVQGMVMGRSYRLKSSGRYVTEDQVEIINAKKNQAILKETKEPVIMSWEKMSKSKFNGVDPTDMFEEYGTDTTRLIILADVAPTSHRNWSSATFPGILNWQNRLWLTLNDFIKVRSSSENVPVDTNSEAFKLEDLKLFDARNFYVKGATFNYRHTHQLSVAISKMQGLTNSLRRASKTAMRYSKQYERGLACQLIMLAPMAPHFAAELWSKFVNVPGRLNETTEEFQWNNDVFEQKWPIIDKNYDLDLTVKINGFENCVIKISPAFLNKLSQNDALDLAFNRESVVSYLTDKKIRNTNFALYTNIEAVLNIYADKIKHSKEPALSPTTEGLVRK